MALVAHNLRESNRFRLAQENETGRPASTLARAGGRGMVYDGPMVSGEHGIGEGKTRKAGRGKDNRTGQFTCRWHSPVNVFKLRNKSFFTY
jgi:hypothetical protein